MLIRLNRFNLYLLAGLAVLAMAAGCSSPEKKKEAEQRKLEKKLEKQTAVFRVHVEGRGADTNRCLIVPVYRSMPVQLPLQRAPILTEEHVKKARVIDAVGGFQLQVEFNRQGGLLLEQYTSDYNSKHLAVFCNFTTLTNVDVHEDRWLAAPKITHRLTDGILVFTPDATREEAEHIANSLNNTAKKLGTDK